VFGAYGMVSYSVARRARRLGIRVVLGASPSDVRRLILNEGLLPVVAGAVVGLVLSLSLGGMMASTLFEVRAHDPRGENQRCDRLAVNAPVVTLTQPFPRKSTSTVEVLL